MTIKTSRRRRTLDHAADLAEKMHVRDTLKKNRSPKDVARRLAKEHLALDPKAKVFWDGNGSLNEIRLLEVSPNVADTDEVLAFKFSADPKVDLHYDLRLILLSPGEWEKVKTHRLCLPDGWGDPNTFRQLSSKKAG